MSISIYTGRSSFSWLSGPVMMLLMFLMAMLFADRVLGLNNTQLFDTTQDKQVVMVAQQADDYTHKGGLADKHHFDTINGKAESPARLTEQSTDTAQELYLKGILATEDYHLGYAIIRSPDEQEWHFRTGESVYGIATLEEIHIDRVILRRDSRRVTLYLPAEFMVRNTAMERARKLEAKRIVSDFRSKLVKRDGMELIKMFGFDTVYKNGGFYGFMVKVIGEDSARMLEVLGIEESDLITAVNGKRFAESIEAVQSLAELKDATEVDVEIERNGVPMFFHFDFDQLGADGAEEPQAASVELEDAAAEIEESTTP